MAYEVIKMDADEDASWDAEDWCFTVMQGDDIICICATEDEANHLAALLNEKPYAAASSD